MIISPELAQRLKQNLVFSGEDQTGVVGAFNILVRNETKESIDELFGALEGLVRSEGIVGLKISEKSPQD